MIALNTPTFWIVCVVAVVAVVPIRSFAVRKGILACVNATFVVLLLQWQAIGLAGAILATYLVLQLIARPRYRVLFGGLLGVLVVSLFVIHKLPTVSTNLGTDAITRVLAVIGYSYVALRIIEVLRAVFEGRHEAPDFVSMVNYLLPFHMLAAGPIQAYDDFVAHANDQFEPSGSDVLVGFERIASGLFKKLVLAHLLQTLFLTNLESSGLYFFLEMQLTFIWLFLDFSAYSDIAAGVGILIGVATPENFNRPLLARNLIDFWERWHISLSQFIRRNVFIPIQLFLMRRNEGRSPLLSFAVAIAISFVLCGLWHGLGTGFLIWGVVQALGLVVARIYADILKARLGRAGVQKYLMNPWFKAAGIVLTFEVQATALLALIKG
jgi:D-alanyl-lipoteichoic acid acyltransferase DltB (MBOAT superfamily)